jgi:hypothetical protein
MLGSSTPMTNEDFQSKIDFIINQQAQFSSDL